jgi:NAD(P)-dependent dehydrogenase (short-subunit alcohol dehydrogenase family)
MLMLEGKVAIITGAGSGMGRSMSQIFSAQGAKIVAADWNQESLDGIVAELADAGRDVVGIQGDVSKREDCELIVKSAVEAFGRLDVLCNNAGVMDLNQGVAELEDEMWNRVMGINVYGPMCLTRAAVPEMIKGGGGSIVNSGSVAGQGGAAAGAAYTVSKHALKGLTRSTAYIYAHDGIRCNLIAIGAVETNIMQSVDPTKMDPKASERLQKWYGMIPWPLKPEDIAHVALFLASDEAKGVNGAVLATDAGWTSA